MREREIQDSTVGIVADNATNFGKAFCNFGTQSELSYQDQVAEEEGDEEEDEQARMKLHQLQDIFDSGEDDNDEQLPYQYRCAGHTLSMAATADISASLKPFNGAYTRLFKKVFGKLKAVGKL